MEKPKEKEKGPPAYSVDDAMNKGRQLPQMLDFLKDRWWLVEQLWVWMETFNENILVASASGLTDNFIL